MNQKVCVAFVTDENYAIPTAVAIRSLIENYRGEEPLQIYVGIIRVSAEKRKAFYELSDEKVHVNLLEMDDSRVSDYGDYQGINYITTTAYLRVCLPELLPQYDKILYLDGDVLVRKDISSFLQEDIRGYYAAVIADMSGMAALHWEERLHRMRYFNSGVLLMNAARMRENNIEDKFFHARIEHPEFVCMDQDIFNYVFEEEVKFLPQRFNLMMYNLYKDGFTLNEINTFYNTEYASMEEMESDAVVLHLTNEYKPWKYKDSYMSEQWMGCFQRSPFARFSIIRQTIPRNDSLNKTSAPVCRRKGPFKKIAAKEKTTLYFCGIPVAQKVRRESATILKVFKIPVAKRIHARFETRTRYFGGIVVCRNNYAALRSSMDEQWEKVLQQIRYTGGKTDSAVAEQQVLALKNMQKQMQNREEKE